MENNTMTVEEFVNKYKETEITDRQELIKNIIRDKYVSLYIKNALAKDMIKKHSMENENYETDTVLIYLSYAMSIITLYTNIETEKGSWVNEYDMLQRYGLIEQIAQEIGEDVKEFQNIFNMCKEDFYKNHLSTQGFVQRQVDKVLDKVLPGLEKLNTHLERIDMSKVLELMKSELMKRVGK